LQNNLGYIIYLAASFFEKEKYSLYYVKEIQKALIFPLIRASVV